MLRNAILGLIPAFALGLLSCTVDPTTEEVNTAEDESALVAADRDMFGTYRAIVTTPGGMPLLVLKTDGTYHRTIRMPCPTTGPCVPAQDDGEFGIRQNGRTSYMYLYSDTGGVGAYQFDLEDETLRLRPVDKRELISMRRTVEATWCGERQDCMLQNLSDPSCMGTWMCGSNLCNYGCMAGPVEEPQLVEDPDPTF